MNHVIHLHYQKQFLWPLRFYIIGRFQPSLYTWCVNEVAIISFVEWLIENKKDAIGQHHMYASPP